jgi:signal transduction histidine kinase
MIFPILAITILANLTLGWAAFRNQRHSLSAKLFVLIILGIVSWAFAKIIFYYGEQDIINRITIPLLYISGAFIATSFLIFAYAFPSEKRNFSKKLFVVALPAPIVVGIALLAGDSIVGDMIEVNHVRGVMIGDFYFAYVFFIAAYFILGHLKLIQRFKKSTGILRVQIIYFFLGSSISSLSGIFTNVILPWTGNFSLYWLGPPLTITLVVLVTYSIVKHHLLNARVIATELFTALVLLVVLFDALVSQTIGELITRLGVFIGTSIFGAFLIRGTLREIKELERLSHAKSEFVSIASHQLRTPLTAIKGFISMIQEGSGSEEDRKSWLSKVFISNERLIRLVSDLLDISRIERGTVQYDFKEADINALIGDVVSTLRPQADLKNINIKYEKLETPLLLSVDEEKVRQVILNLIDNAIKYTEKGGVIVRLLHLKDLHKVRIVVQDTGIGLHAEDISKLFNLFSRGEGGEKTDSEGVGIGLYVARKIVEAHHGKIWAESEGLHKGSRFYVELPTQ